MEFKKTEHTIELLFVTLFSVFFSFKFGEMQKIGLELGSQPDSTLLFIGYNVLMIFSFIRLKSYVNSNEKISIIKEIIYYVFVIIQSLAPYLAMQISWWYEFHIYELNRGLINAPEGITILYFIVYTFMFLILPPILSTTKTE